MSIQIIESLTRKVEQPFYIKKIKLINEIAPLITGYNISFLDRNSFLILKQFSLSFIMTASTQIDKNQYKVYGFLPNISETFLGKEIKTLTTIVLNTTYFVDSILALSEILFQFKNTDEQITFSAEISLLGLL